jgi:hypothetical protein
MEISFLKRKYWIHIIAGYFFASGLIATSILFVVLYLNNEIQSMMIFKALIAYPIAIWGAISGFNKAKEFKNMIKEKGNLPLK